MKSTHEVWRTKCLPAFSTGLTCTSLCMNMIKLRYIISIAAVVALNVVLCFSACARAEYEVNGECCPMCAPGTVYIV